MARTAKKKRRGSGRLNRKARVGTAFRQFVGASSDALLRLEPDAAKADAETVHHFRTAIRRLRSLLTTFKPILPNGPRAELSDRLKLMAQHYGTLRELDVLLEALDQPLKEEGSEEHPGLEALANAARQARVEEQAKNGRLLDDIVAIDRTLASAEWLRDPPPERTELWEQKLDDYVPKLLDKSRRNVRKRARNVDGGTDAAALHKLRIATKKHRYLIESISFLFQKKAVKKYLQQLVAMQDVLGEMHDADMARSLVGRLTLSDENRGLAMNWLSLRAADARQRYASCDKAIRALKPFWD